MLHFFLLESIYIPNIKISSNGLDIANFLHFLSILAVFWLKNGQKRSKSKKSFFVAFLFVGKHLHTKYQNFIKRFGYCQFSSFFVNFGCFLVKKRLKRPKSKKSFFVAFCFVEKHLHTKFQKISSNSLDFANFLHFWSILAVLG